MITNSFKIALALCCPTLFSCQKNTPIPTKSGDTISFHESMETALIPIQPTGSSYKDLRKSMQEEETKMGVSHIQSKHYFSGKFHLSKFKLKRHAIIKGNKVISSLKKLIDNAELHMNDMSPEEFKRAFCGPEVPESIRAHLAARYLAQRKQQEKVTLPSCKELIASLPAEKRIGNS